MGSEQDTIIFIILLAVLSVAIIAAVVFYFRYEAQKTKAALALTPEEVRQQYAPEMPSAPLLYSVRAGNSYTIRNVENQVVARTRIAIAQKTCCRTIHINTVVYECHREFGLTGDKVHLYDAGADSTTAEPLLTCSAHLSEEVYTRADQIIYKRKLLGRQAGKGWPVYGDSKEGVIVGYLEGLQFRMKANAFLFHATKDIPLVEQLFILAMSDKH